MRTLIENYQFKNVIETEAAESVFNLNSTFSFSCKSVIQLTDLTNVQKQNVHNLVIQAFNKPRPQLIAEKQEPVEGTQAQVKSEVKPGPLEEKKAENLESHQVDANKIDSIANQKPNTEGSELLPGQNGDYDLLNKVKQMEINSDQEEGLHKRIQNYFLG